MAKPESIKFLAISTLFLLSGLSSLIYQVIWTRLLVFVFGSTTLATSTVLAVFMGGLAIGSFVAGRFADRMKRPFLWYGILEGIIGLWALAAPVLFGIATPLYKLAFEPLHNNFIAFGLLRFLVAAVILLLPTACMGATLPLLSRFVTENLDRVGDRVGSLYAINTLGAVAGSLLAGFMLLPTLGLKATTLIAAAINVSLTLSVFLLSRSAGFMGKSISATPGIISLPAHADSTSQTTGKLPGIVKVTLMAIAASGALAMTYEVAWTRSLLMVIGSTTYAFTVMLSTFLIGIFLGSFLSARFVDRLKMPILWFGLFEMLLCLCGLASILLFNVLPYFNILVASYYGQSPEISMLFRFAGAGMLLIPISLCLGFIFPMAVKVCARDLEHLGTSVGQLYAANTVGAIVGAFVSGFFVIPILGVELTLIACSAANLVLGMVLLALYGPLRTSIKCFCGLAVMLVLFWVSRAPEFWDHLIITEAQHQRRALAASRVPDFSQWQEGVRKGVKLIFYKDGKTANVAVMQGQVRSLFTNGHVDASDGLDMENQAMLAVYPLLACPGAADVCVIGWGSGVTAGFGLQFPVKRLVCSEIEPVVVATSSFFHKVNFKPESDKRTTVEVSDGRNFLMGTSEKFDVIISEPSNPWQAGVCNLFTQEYFQICRDSLNKGGVFTMWSQISEVPPENLAQVFAALHNVFPCVFVMDSGIGDINALAFAEPHMLSFEGLKKSFSNQQLLKNLSGFRLTTPEDFIARIIVCPSGIEETSRQSAANTDDTNRLEYDVAKTYENKIFQAEDRAWMATHHGPIWDSIDWGQMTAGQKSAEFIQIARACLSRNLNYALLWCRESSRLHENAEALALAAEIQIEQRNYAQAAKIIKKGEKLFGGDARFPGLSGVIALNGGDYVLARRLLAKALELNSSDCNFRYFLALCYTGLNVEQLDGPFVLPPSIEPERVVELCKAPSENARFASGKPRVFLVLADAYNRLGKYADAEGTVKKLLALAPRGFLSWQLLAESYGAEKLFQRSSYCWNRSYELSGLERPSFLARAKQLLKEKKDMEALRLLQRLVQMAPADSEVLSLLNDLGQHNQKARQYYDSLSKDSTILKTATPDTSREP